MSTSARILLQLCGVPIVPGTQLQSLVETVSAVDWLRLTKVAGQEHLLALVAANLDRNGLLGQLPAAVQDVMRLARLRALVTFTQQQQALAEISGAFSAQDIEFIALKGVALAHQIYPDPETRPVGDIDIWVRPGAAPAAAAALQQAGFTPLPDAHNRSTAFLAKFGEQQAFVEHDSSSADSIDVDLHWRLLGTWWLRKALGVPEQTLFASIVAINVAGETVKTLNPTAALFYLCLHAGLHHQFQGLRWLIDLALLARQPDVDWLLLRTLAVRSRTRMIVWYALNLLDRALDSEYAGRLRWTPAKWHARLVKNTLAARGAALAQENKDLDAHPEQFVLLPNVGAVAGTILRLLWPPADWLRLRYTAPDQRSLFAARLNHLARLRNLLPGG